MEPRLHIAVVGLRGLPDTYSGMERVCEELYPGLAARGHRVTVFSGTAAPLASIPDGGNGDDGITLVRTSGLRWAPAQTLSRAVSSIARIAAVGGDTGAVDVVHLHALAPGLTAWAYRLLRVPTVLTVHGLDWRRARWRGPGSRVLKLAERSAVRFADKMIVVSSELQDYYRDIYGRATHLIHNAIDFAAQDRPGRPEVLREWGLMPRGYVLFVGRLVPEKRVEDIVRAVRLGRVPTTLAVVGDGPSDYVARVRRLADGDGRVVFLGIQDRPAIRELIRGACATVSASELEGMPLSLLESVAQGIPAIASDIPPHREAFATAPGYGLFFPTGDVAALATRLRHVVERQADERARAEAIRSALARVFAVGRMIEETERVLVRAYRRSPPEPGAGRCTRGDPTREGGGRVP